MAKGLDKKMKLKSLEKALKKKEPPKEKKRKNNLEEM